jgi:hypothetical protein
MLQSGDMRFALPPDLTQSDNGGGPPTSNLVPDGASNAWFPDLSPDARVGGLAEVVHGHAVLRTTDTDQLLGANLILADPPDDPNVSITLIKSPGPFSKRPDLAKIIEATSAPGPEFAGYLLENHQAGRRDIVLVQRPDAIPPSVNTSLVLILNEGLLTAQAQYVRVRRVTTSEQTYTTSDGQGNPVEFKMQRCVCELYSELLFDFAGSPPSRFYARNSTKTLTRTVTFSDAGTFYSASRLRVAVTDPAAMEIKVESVFTQIVPNTRTETPLLNQMSAGVRTVDLVDYLGTLQVSAASHTQRLFITEANAGYSYVFKLTPPPAPNSIAVSYVALGTWNTLFDDGAGGLGAGPGSGDVLYSTGDGSVTTEFVPDFNTFLLITHADTAPFVNNCPTGPVNITTRAPEFELDITPGASLAGATVAWLSGGLAKAAAINAAGVISGDATGLAVSALGKVYIRPGAMPDPGTNFTISYQSRPTLTETISGASPDAGGYITITTAQEAVPGTMAVKWVTARNVSVTSGADLSGTSSTESSETLSLGGSTSQSFGGGQLSTRTSITNSTYTEKTESSTSSQIVVSHQLTDDGAGGFGDPLLGSVNYAGKTASVRVVTEGASVTSYQQDHEDATSFYTSGGTITSMSS